MSTEMNAEKFSSQQKQYHKRLLHHPIKTLAIVTLGDDESSKVYVNNKKRELVKYNYNYQHIQLSENSHWKDLAETIKFLNANPSVTGIIIQQPLPKEFLQRFGSLVRNELNTLISPSKDVDGLHPMSIFEACTPLGIIQLMLEYGVPFREKHIVICGRSDLVGKPLARILMNTYDCTVSIIHSHTARETVESLLNSCDIFVSAIGKPKYWTLKDFSVIDKTKIALIDVGINRDTNGKLCGDVDPEVYELFEYYTPVPKGVGLMTVASLIANLNYAE